MKNKKLFLLSAFVLLMLAACQKDDEVHITNVEHVVSAVDENRNFIQIWGKNETMSLKCHAKSSISDLTVKTFDVYFNGELVGSANGRKECEVNYPLNGTPEGLSELKIVTKTQASGYSESTHTSTLPIWINDVKPEASIEMNCPSTISNGEAVTATFTFDTNIKKARSPKVLLYWDNSQISSSSTSPYDILFKVNDQKAGIHEVYAWVLWSIDGFGQIGQRTDKSYVTVNN